MDEDKQKQKYELEKVLVYCLAVIVGGVGFLAVNFAKEWWEFLIGAVLFFGIVWLMRQASKES